MILGGYRREVLTEATYGVTCGHTKPLRRQTLEVNDE